MLLNGHANVLAKRVVGRACVYVLVTVFASERIGVRNVSEWGCERACVWVSVSALVSEFDCLGKRVFVPW